MRLADEWIVPVMKSMYEHTTTAVEVNGRASKAIVVKVAAGSWFRNPIYTSITIVIKTDAYLCPRQKL